METSQAQNLYDLIGSKYEEFDRQDLEITQIKNSTYANNYAKGISYVFSNQVLDYIIIYGNQDKKFQIYQGKLPFGLSFSEYNSSIVQRFGEPQVKNSIPNIYIVYQKIGLQIDFIGTDWNDTQNQI